MIRPLVSVVVTTFNSERFLREGLDSVFAQAYPAIEVIVVDGASADGTLEILGGYSDRLRVLSSSGPCLPGVTRNMGIEAATGEYIAFLDSDDAWYPGKVEAQVEFMALHPDIPLCHTYVHIIDEHSAVLQVRHEGAMPPTGDGLRPLLRHCFITLSSVMVRREVVMREGIRFPTDPAWDWTGEEHLFFLRIARAHPLGFLDRVLAQYRRHGGGISSRIGWKIVPENIVIHENVLVHPGYWEGVVPRGEPLAAFVDACLSNSIYWRDRREPGRAAYFALRALRRDPANARAWMDLAKALLKPLVRKPCGLTTRSHT